MLIRGHLAQEQNCKKTTNKTKRLKRKLLEANKLIQKIKDIEVHKRKKVIKATRYLIPRWIFPDDIRSGASGEAINEETKGD